jgi:cellulose synthase/poly-beta-1,6-N-acetylglucosamine synthase-like glycosyltransferase
MTIIILFTLALLVGYAVLLGYYRSAWQSLPSWSGTAITGSTRVTIIIPARNEAANILPCLHSILAQAYPAHLLEVIVADDFSTDDTAALTLSVKHPSLRLLRLSDCIVPPHWLTTIVSFYETHQPAFIAAPVVFGSRPGALALFQSLDFMTLQGITGAAVHRRFHAMCNGANLAYERSAFESVGGFAGINHIASGDDMLLMHKIGTRYPDRVLFLKSPDVIVTTAPAPTLRAFLQQRIRWASKADKYEDKRIFGVLLLVYLLNVLFLVLPILAWFTPCPGRGVLIWLGLLSGKTLAELYFLFPVARFFSKTHWLWWFAPAQPFHILYTVVAGWLGKFGRYEWKQRQVQ